MLRMRSDRKGEHVKGKGELWNEGGVARPANEHWLRHQRHIVDMAH